MKFKKTRRVSVSQVECPKQVTQRMVGYMQEAGLSPVFIYAFQKTGRIVTEENRALLSAEDIEEWRAACEEYESKQRARGEGNMSNSPSN